MKAELHLNTQGWVEESTKILSPNQDARPVGMPIELVVLHNISLPPKEFGGQGVIALFTNTLNPEEHPFYAEIQHLRVSAHFLIRRDGQLIQFVSTEKRAWHAGVSSWEGRPFCNSFSIGIELEGTDETPFAPEQYARLNALMHTLEAHYPSLKAVTGHSHIAPDRKTDPGPFFDWAQLLTPLIKPA